MKLIECVECRKLFTPKQEQRFCSRHCARINQARHGVPSLEDRKARVLDAVSAAIDKEFKR